MLGLVEQPRHGVRTTVEYVHDRQEEPAHDRSVLLLLLHHGRLPLVAGISITPRRRRQLRQIQLLLTRIVRVGVSKASAGQSTGGVPLPDKRLLGGVPLDHDADAFCVFAQSRPGHVGHGDHPGGKFAPMRGQFRVGVVRLGELVPVLAGIFVLFVGRVPLEFLGR
uniref:(northern house mosquito) hypothetical protein n=1 Tax=Culex pipiens TaxID=7175 RepID=A0A8D8F383_CULPI